MPVKFEDDPQDVKVTQEQVRKYLGPKKKPEEVVGQGISAGEELGISASDWRDTFRNYVSPTLRGFSRLGGEAVGATRGGLPGAAAGGMAADQIYTQTLGRISPRLFGGPSGNALEDLKASGLETGADLAFDKGIPALKQTLKSKAISKFFPPNPNLPIREAVSSLPEGFEPTIGQATGSETAKWLENIVIPSSKWNLRIQQQQGALRKEAERLSNQITEGGSKLDTSEIGAAAGNAAQKQYKAMHEVKNTLYANADEALSKEKFPAIRVEQKGASGVLDKFGNHIKGGPVAVDTVITAPVFPKETAEFANTVLDSIDRIAENPNTQAYQSPEARAAFKALRDKVASFTSGNLVSYDGQRVMEYATAKADEQELNSLLYNIPYDARRQLFETVKALRNKLSYDVKQSSLTWSKEAKNALDKADDYYKNTFQKIFGNDIAQQFTRTGEHTNNPEVIEENLINSALNNATLAKRVTQATGSGVYLGSEYFKRLMNEMVDVNGTMMGTRGMEYLQSTEEIAKQFLSRDQRDALKNFARQVQVATWKEGGIPRTSLAFRGAYMGLSIASGVLAGQFTGSPLAGALGFAVIPYADKKLAKMMLNPANARLAARLSRLKPGDPESQSIMKKLFKTGLKGARFDMQTATGTSLGLFEAKSDGKLHPVEQVQMPEDQKLKVTFE